MKKILACLLVLVLALTCFVACGKKDGDKAAATVEGKYVISSMDGLGSSLEEYLAAVEMKAEDFMTLELKADGAASLNMAGEGGDGTWTQDGDKITLTIDGDSMEFTLSGNELKGDFDGEGVVLVKQ